MLKRFVSAVLCVMMALSVTVVQFSDSPGYSVEAAVDYEIPYYYKQLSANAKKVYKKLREAALECKPEVKLENITLEDGDFDMLSDLLMAYDPMMFHISHFHMNSSTSKKTNKTTLTFQLTYSYKKATYDKMTAAFEKKADDILSKLTDDMGKYQKLCVIHDELIKSIAYDLESSASYNAYGALVKKKAACEGYANAFTYLCTKAGIRSINVCGESSHNGKKVNHMWNKVYYNNKWYNVDVTWDDPTNSLKDNITHEYFMISDSSIKKDHTEENGGFEVPKATDNSINYYQVSGRYADSLSSAKELINSGLTSAAMNGWTYYDFKCSSASVYNDVKKYADTKGNINGVLKNVKKNTGANIIANAFLSSYNDSQYVIRILVFYDGTSINDYFTDPNAVDSSIIKGLAGLGIK